MRFLRPGRGTEGSIFGFVLVMAAVLGGRYIAESPSLAPHFTYSAIGLAWMLVIYGFIASITPIWLLLPPRGALLSFVELVTLLALHVGNLLALSPLPL